METNKELSRNLVDVAIGVLSAWGKPVAELSERSTEKLCKELDDAFSAALVARQSAPVASAPAVAVPDYSPLFVRIDEAIENYVRHGAICEFEGQPMIYAATLLEIGNLLGEVAPNTEAAPQPAAAPVSPKIEEERADFEDWYTGHARDIKANPIGSYECALMWAAWVARSGGYYKARGGWQVSPQPWGIDGAIGAPVAAAVAQDDEPSRIADVILSLIHSQYELNWFENEEPFVSDQHEKDYLTDLVRKALAAAPQPPADAAPVDEGPVALKDVRTLRRCATQIERLASIFSDERSLFCRHAAILLDRIAYNAQPFPVQADADLPEGWQHAANAGLIPPAGYVAEAQGDALSQQADSVISAQQFGDVMGAIAVASKEGRAAGLEEAAKVCDEYAEKKWALYKGHAPYLGNEEGRADPQVQGESNGAEECANYIRALNK